MNIAMLRVTINERSIEREEGKWNTVVRGMLSAGNEFPSGYNTATVKSPAKDPECGVANTPYLVPKGSGN